LWGLSYKDPAQTLIVVKKLISLALEDERGFTSYNILMSIFRVVLSQDKLDLTVYGTFFQDFADDQDSNKFAFKVIENKLPKFSAEEITIFSIDPNQLSNSNLYVEAKDSIFENDKNTDSTEMKSVSISHYLVDFQHFLIKEKLDHLILPHGPGSEDCEYVVNDM